MINIIVNKIVSNLDEMPEQWDLGTYLGVRYASRHVEDLASNTIELFEDRIEFGFDTLDIPEGLRGKVKVALDNLSVREAREERISSEQAIYSVVGGW